MKAITICNPYPELIMLGEKIIENRDWRKLPTYRGPIAIHAGKSRDWFDADLMSLEQFNALPFGAFVGTADLIDAQWLEDLSPELRAHRHAHGPACLVLANVRRLPSPIPYRGYFDIWNAPDELFLTVAT
jgi:hypothetical protein